MSRRTIAILVGSIVLGGLGWLVFASNLLRSEGAARFSAGPGNLNTLSVDAPYGWYCIEFSKTPNSFDPTKMEVTSKSMSECPFFGSDSMMSNEYPDSGEVAQIPLEQPALVYQNRSKTYEIYVLITKDRSKYDSLE